MNQFLNKLERKYGRYAIPDLTRYIIVLYCAGAVLGIISPMIYYNFLSLNFNAIFHGQVWRLFTYLIEPYGFNQGMGFLVSVLFLAIEVNLIFLFGRSLEQAWGTFRYNLYFISGYLLNILAALILYLSPIHSSYYASGFQYIYLAMFLAFATVNPDMELLLFFVLPVKVKWLGILDGIYLLVQIMQNLVKGVQCLLGGQASVAGVYFSIMAAIVVAMLNFLIYFFTSRDYRRISPQEYRRKQRFRKQVKQAEQRKNSGTRHRCAICGRTELDDPNLDFRYCSKCHGNYEYCSDHLFTHQHVTDKKN